jgi:hypothetical protein
VHLTRSKPSSLEALVEIARPPFLKSMVKEMLRVRSIRTHMLLLEYRRSHFSGQKSAMVQPSFLRAASVAFASLTVWGYFSTNTTPGLLVFRTLQDSSAESKQCRN